MVEEVTKIVILLEHRAYNRAIYGLNLNLYIGLKVLTALTIKNVFDIIKKNEIQFIFLDNSGYTKDMAKAIYMELDRLRIDIPLFVMGKTEVREELVTVFGPRTQLRYVLQSIAKSLNVTAKSMAAEQTNQYFTLPMEFIVPGWFCSTELFIKDKDEYRIVIETDDVISGELLDDLAGKGVDQLYVASSKRLRFVNALTFQLNAKLNDPTLSKEEKIQATATAHQIVMDQARSVGVSDSTIELANSCVESMLNIVAEFPTLDGMLQQLLSQESTFMFKHSNLIAYIGTHIIKKMPWSSNEQQQNLAFVAMFHDISLTRDEYAMIHSDKKLEEADLSEEEKEIISKHALLSAQIIGQFEKVPYGVDTIIKQHHGSTNGIGLSSINLNISPMAVVFIFAEEWAKIMLKSQDNKITRPDKEEVIRLLQKKYNIPAFNKVLPALQSLDF
jgi:HD-GYP domain-containing protein (c-di-GMP phosphodiesterase class II)